MDAYLSSWSGTPPTQLPPSRPQTKRRRDTTAAAGKRETSTEDLLLNLRHVSGGLPPMPDEASSDLSAARHWAKETEDVLRSDLANILRNPPDGERQPVPPTRRGLAAEEEGGPGNRWLGVMMIDCGYETPRTLVRDTMSQTRGGGGGGGGADSEPVKPRTVVWMTGRDEYGRSVCVYVEGAIPYFYVGVADEDVDRAEDMASVYATELQEYLEKKCVEGTSRYGRGPSVLRVEAVKRGWFYGYKYDPKTDGRRPDWDAGLQGAAAYDGVEPSPSYQASDWYLKVSAGAPYHVNRLREWAHVWSQQMEIDTADRPAGKRWRIPVTFQATRQDPSAMGTKVTKMAIFEANVEFNLRFMIDRGLIGAGWFAVNLQAGPQDGLLRVLGTRPGMAAADASLKRSDCDIEITVDAALFERAESVRDAVLSGRYVPPRVDGGSTGDDDHPTDDDPYQAIRYVLQDAPLRVVSREANTQRLVDGTVDPSDDLHPWFERLRDNVAPMRILSFDIECHNPDCLFPDATRPEDQVIGICSYLYRSDRVEAWQRRRAAQMPPKKAAEALEEALKALDSTRQVLSNFGTLILLGDDDDDDDGVVGRPPKRRKKKRKPPPGWQGPSPDKAEAEMVAEAEARVQQAEAAYVRARQETADKLSSLRGDGLEGMDCTERKWPPPLDIVAMGLGTRTNQRRGDMDGYPVRTIAFESERELLMTWSRYLCVTGADIVMGYNSVSFDMAYLFERAETLGVQDVCWKVGRFPQRRCPFREVGFGGSKKSAQGERQERVADIHGRVQVDILRCRRDDFTYKPRSYKLDWVSRHFLDEGKTGLKYKEIPAKYAGSDEDRAELDEYCLADAVLPFKMAMHCHDMTQLVEMARVCGVPLKFLTDKGMQARVFGQILRKTRERGMAVPWLKTPGMLGEGAGGGDAKKRDDYTRKIGYRGATVIDPKPGCYTTEKDGVTVCLDFASLYPACMRAKNLCYTTVLGDPRQRDRCARTHALLAKQQQQQHHDDDTDGRDRPKFWGSFMDREWEREKAGWKIAPIHGDDKPERNPPFVLSSVRRGILPAIEDDLIEARGRAKAAMAKCVPGSPEHVVQNSRQTALKLGCNSVYGVTGMGLGRLPNLEVSASVTAYGREALSFAIYVSDKVVAGNNEVIYGDSVTGDTPILCRFGADGPAVIRTIDGILGPAQAQWGQWGAHHDGKEHAVPPSSAPVYVWSEQGWTILKRVIRHKTSKRIFRVLTHTGCVDVTEDHSLLRAADGESVAPKDLKPGDELLHCRLPLPDDTPGSNGRVVLDRELGSLEEKRAFCWGFFYADGHSAANGWRWGICKQNTQLLDKTMGYLKEIYADNADELAFTIVDNMESSRVYRLLARGRGMSKLSRRFRALFYDEKRRIKKIPDEILTAPLAIRQAFWQGYYSGDGDKDSCGYVRCDNKGKLGSAGLFYLMRSLGYPVSINTRQDKPLIFRLTGTRNRKRQRRAPEAIKKVDAMQSVSQGRYVYDLQTENHHFAAGIGNMVVHNTDSVMVLIHDVATHEASSEPGLPLQEVERRAIGRAIERGKAICAIVSRELGMPMKLEFEHAFAPYLLIKKKKYVALKWTNAEAPEGLKARGIESVRRDNPHITGLLCKRFTNLIMGLEKDPDDPKKYVAVVPQLALGVEFVRECHRRLLADELPVEALVITEELKRRPENYKMWKPHVGLTVRMTARDPGSAPRPGERVPYVIVTRDSLPEATHGQKDVRKLWQRSEDPEYAKEHGLQVDVEWYAKNRFHKVFMRLLVALMAPHVLQEVVDEDRLRGPRMQTGHAHQADLDVDRWLLKRQERAEKVVWDAVFRENMLKRRHHRSHRTTDPIVQAFAVQEKIEAEDEALLEALFGTAEDPALDDDNDADGPEPSTGLVADAPTGFREEEKEEDEEEEEEVLEEDVRKRLEALLDDILDAARANMRRQQQQQQQQQQPQEDGEPPRKRQRRTQIAGAPPVRRQTRLESFFRPPV
jgi:DNA polymerase elongation subunit (family B)